MNTIKLDTIRECFEGVIPAVLGTADLADMPNASYLSQVQYMDRDHVALSYQFFNKTRANILANPNARLTVVNPYTQMISVTRNTSEPRSLNTPVMPTCEARPASLAFMLSNSWPEVSVRRYCSASEYWAPV